MKFRVYRTERFEKEFHKLPNAEKREIGKFEEKLSENPFLGKPLGYPFFREKKLNNRRVYYLVYENFVVVLIVAIGDKKTQQATIEDIKRRLDDYQQVIKDALIRS